KIQVSQNNCSLQIEEKSSNREHSPGSNVTFLIQGNLGDSIGLIGVDEAVYVLRNKDKLTPKRVLEELEKHDFGCGPGGGYNSIDVLQSAGLLLSGWFKDASQVSEKSSCDKTVRVKREISEIASSYQGISR